MEITLSESEEKALVGVLYNHVSFGTTLQVFNELAADNGRIETLRETFRKLLKKYDLLKTLSPEELLLPGLIEEMNKGDLKSFAQNENNRHLQKRAQYFLGN